MTNVYSICHKFSIMIHDIAAIIYCTSLLHIIIIILIMSVMYNLKQLMHLAMKVML